MVVKDFGTQQTTQLITEQVFLVKASEEEEAGETMTLPGEWVAAVVPDKSANALHLEVHLQEMGVTV